ncbi:MAG: NADH:ubiquinone oxidoreductase subunit F (NADH-binding)/NADH:ubiquinone oxidoreductase subunit E [Verrucomicrobiales bacterium]|jgi:NADH:ubiquinone oxidoreductase subunit F (NADH-binding)/NADH:ubiquinone oxidoreductase subunit E
MSKNLSALSFRKGVDQNIFEKMVDSAEATGTAETKEQVQGIAKAHLVGEAISLGAVSFYDFLKKENEGKKVFWCNGSACLTAGTQSGLKEQLGKHFKEEEIGHICCLGRCHECGAFQHNGKNYSAKSDEELAAICEKGEGDDSDNYAVGSNLEKPILTAPFPGVDEYYAALQQLLGRERDDVLTDLKDSGLRGRGGAGFPLSFKWQSCREVEGGPKYIVCNADEGDPGAYIDKYLMELQPHSVLFGMIAAGWFIGAEVGVLYIRAEYPDSIRIVEEAIAELHEKGILGNDIFGTGFKFDLKVIKGAGAYICGEETALLSSLEGHRPEVRVRPPFPTVEGLFRKPTVLNNVETFANLHAIVTMGGAEYAKIGTEKSSGPKLVSIDSIFNKPGIYEVAMGTPLKEVVYDLGGGFKQPVKGVQVGGPLGGIVPTDKIGELTVDFESFKDGGFLLGHAGIVSIPESFPMLDYIEHMFEFTADESCGKCFPCRLGSVRGKELAAKARTSDYKIDPELMHDLLDTMMSTSLCALGGGVPLPIKNALEYFKDELQPHFSEKL